MKLNKIKFIVSSLVLLFIPLSAYANAGVPMIFISYPVMLLSLIPIILIESLIFSKKLKINYH